MKLSDYLLATQVADLPITHKWDEKTTARIVGADPDNKPKLSTALEKVNQRAICAFGVAAGEWVLARLATHADIADGLLRLEAAWAATIDSRYSTLTRPEYGPRDADMRLAAPVWLTGTILADLHKRYRAGQRPNVYRAAFCMTLLAEHVAGKSPAFKKWVPAKLEQLAAAYPNEDISIADEPPVARESLLSDALLGTDATEAAQRAFVATLDPAQNPYLTPAATLEAAGLTSPYPGR